MIHPPHKPSKPSKREPAPSRQILIHKLLVIDKDKKYHLLDEKSHPQVFPYGDFEPNYDELWKLNFDHELEGLKFSDYKLIFDILSIDFKINEIIENDYYQYSVVEYVIDDPDYDLKVEKFNNRFKKYEDDLIKYDVKFKEYQELKRLEKVAKLEKELKKVKNV